MLTDRDSFCQDTRLKVSLCYETPYQPGGWKESVLTMHEPCSPGYNSSAHATSLHTQLAHAVAPRHSKKHAADVEMGRDMEA